MLRVLVDVVVGFAIARLLGVPLGTIKGRLRIGLQKMRGYLTKQGVEAPG